MITIKSDENVKVLFDKIFNRIVSSQQQNVFLINKFSKITFSWETNLIFTFFRDTLLFDIDLEITKKNSCWFFFFVIMKSL